MSDQNDIDKHLDAVLRASGSALRHYTMSKTLEAMRAAMSAAMASASISWTPASSLPDADTTVLLALSDGEVWQGYWDGETWRDTSGMPIAAARVTHWAHTPAHPEPAAQAAPMRTSTGMLCPKCLAKTGELHAAGCPELTAPIESWHTGLPLPGTREGR